MAQGVIDNSEGNTLSEAFDNILPSCDRIDALVGYFYFSGFHEIYQEVADKKIRILVGLEIDEKILHKLSRMDEVQIDQEHLVADTTDSKVLAKQRYFEQFAAMANETDAFDSDHDVKVFDLFLKKIEDGTLEIRKTARPEHGKFYILSFREGLTQGGMNNGVVIEGSSNLTRNGLRGQGEHNRLLREDHYYQSDVEKFNLLWSDSDNIVIADQAHAEEFKEELEQRLWLYAKPDPYFVYLRVLEEYFATEEVEKMKTPGQITQGQYSDLQYQIDAVNIGIDRIKTFGGVIVADVVGLGKSIIASAIAHNLGMKAVVIAPPHLVDQWNDYRTDFNFNAQVFSTGKVEEALQKFGTRKEELLIILDEAHKHRNEDTVSYQLLHKLCAGNKVMALSATPFNNDPKDIYALIKLFDTPGQSTLRTVENLSMEFHALISQYKNLRTQIRKQKNKELSEEASGKLLKRGQGIADQLRQMIEPIVIRRSRLDLDEIRDYREDLVRQGVSFAQVRDPELLEYELAGLTATYVDTLNLIYPKEGATDTRQFTGARYKPAAYLRPGSRFFEEVANLEEGETADDFRQRVLQGQSNVAKFMRTLLVRRFESSIKAFQSTLGKMHGSAVAVKNHYEQRGVVPVLKKGYMPQVEDLNDMDEDELEDLLDKLKGKGLIEIPIAELDPNFIQDLRADIALLEELQNTWKNQDQRFDPKFEHFAKTLERSLKDEPKRKIIVFTEFADTAGYIYERLLGEGIKRVFKYSSSDASTDNKQIIRRNFDAGLAEDQQVNDFDVLIATDAISEGFNLHRAGTIINYDIPYNPTKVIQRIGRINRINKKTFDELYIYNFFPTPTGEDETKTKAISTLKMSIIHALMGEDTKVLTSDEELHNFFAKAYRDEESLNETLSWDAVHRNVWKQTRHNESVMEQARRIPLRTRIARKMENDKGQIVSFAKLGANYIFAWGQAASVEKISPETALGLFAAEPGEKAYETSANFDPVYQEIKRHLFKQNTHPVVNSRSRRHESVQRLLYLASIEPLAKDYCSDVIKLIKDYDALPEGLLKGIIDIRLDKEEPKNSLKELKKLVPIDYISALDKTAQRQKDDGELILLSEELQRA
jgi:superfamily II DNA or RNA helicase